MLCSQQHKQRHSGDELLRLQNAAKIAAKQHSPPSQPLQPDEQVAPNHMKGSLMSECVHGAATAHEQNRNQWRSSIKHRWWWSWQRWLLLCVPGAVAALTVNNMAAAGV